MTESGLDHKAKGAEAETPRRGRGCALGGGGLVLWGRGCALLTVFLDPGDAKLGPSSAQGPPRHRYLKGERGLLSVTESQRILSPGGAAGGEGDL